MPGLADGLGAAVFHRVQDFGFFLVDTADIADRMGEVRAHRVVTNELRLDVDPWQTELVHGQYRDLFFAEFVEQRDGNERMAGLLHGLVEQGSVFGGQMQEVDHFVQLPFDIGGPFASDGEVEAGAVVCQDHAVAVVDQPSGGGDRQYVHAVVFGDRRVVVEFEYLQDVQAHDQGAGNGGDEQGAGHQSLVDQARFLLVVLDRYRLGHVCSILQTADKNKTPTCIRR